MDRTKSHYKIGASFNDKQTYEELKRDSTPTPQCKLNAKLLTLKKTNAISILRYHRLSCLVAPPRKLLQSAESTQTWFPNAIMSSFYGSHANQPANYPTTTLQRLTEKSRQNYSPPRTSLPPSRRYKYTNLVSQCNP